MPLADTIFRKAPPSVVSGYGKRSINLNTVVATFEKHIFLSQTDLTRTGIISFGGISCEKSRFYAKKNHIFSNFRGARAGYTPASFLQQLKYPHRQKLKYSHC
jgi:hypothetical protein